MIFELLFFNSILGVVRMTISSCFGDKSTHLSMGGLVSKTVQIKKLDFILRMILDQQLSISLANLNTDVSQGVVFYFNVIFLVILFQSC